MKAGILEVYPLEDADKVDLNGNQVWDTLTNTLVSAYILMRNQHLKSRWAVSSLQEKRTDCWGDKNKNKQFFLSFRVNIC